MNTDGYLGMGIYPNFGLMGIWVWVNTHIFGYTMGIYPWVQLGYTTLVPTLGFLCAYLHSTLIYLEH